MLSTVKRIWDWVFQPAARYPADPRVVFILALSIFSGLTAILLESGPTTLNYLLPQWGVMAWGILLTIGSALTLGGMPFQSRDGVIAEQIGSAMVAATTLFYSLLAIWTVGVGALQAIGIVFAWGVACGVRYFQLRALIKIAFREQIEHAIAEAIKDEQS